MSKALIAGINQVATDKGLDREVIFQAIEAALISAYKRNYGSIANVSSEVDRITGEMRVFAEREVVEEVINERTEITQNEAQQADPEVKLGDVVRVQTQPADFGRIAAQTAKQVILQRIREAERDTVFENFAHRVGEVINAQVRSADANSGAVTVMLDDKHEALLGREDQIPNERLRRGDYVKVFVVDVHKSTRGPVIKLSRTHRNLLRRLMEQEIPEVREGTVEIKAISREPGARSKAAVVATVPGVDPVGSCVGMRGLRIQNIVNELGGEKIDVVEWNPDLPNYIANALSPAKVSNVLLDDKSPIKTAIVIVPDRQLSLAIGKEGQNARLAAKLTGWRIDIKSESEALREGMDRLSGEQAKAARTGDLFDVAQRLIEGEPGEVGEDMLSRAARSLAELESRATTAESAGVDTSPVEMPEMPMEQRESLEAMWPTEDMLKPEQPAIGESLEPAWEDALPTEPIPSLPSLTDEESAEEVKRVQDLPQVITADMLRARKGMELADIEIPAELLAGLEEEVVPEEEWDEDEDRKAKDKAKAKAKAKKPAKPVKPVKPDAKGKGWRRGGRGGEDFY